MMPAVAAIAGEIVESRDPGELLDLGTFRPEAVRSDRIVDRALRTAASYIASYVDAVARSDPERARVLAESIEVPQVRVVLSRSGRSKRVVEVVRLSEYLRAWATHVGEGVALRHPPRRKALASRRIGKASRRP